MLRKINVILLIGLSFFYIPSYGKDILKDKESRSSKVEEIARVEEIAEELIHLNASLESLTISVSNLFPRSHHESSFQ